MDGFSIAMMCLALNVHYEARGEPIEGQMAVVGVTMNRAKAKHVDFCDVVFAPKQFSWTEKYSKDGVLTQKGKPKGKCWGKSKRVARQAYELYLRGVDHSNGAVYFHAVYVNPVWAKTKVKVVHLGQHIFYKEPSNESASTKIQLAASRLPNVQVDRAIQAKDRIAQASTPWFGWPWWGG